MFKHIMVATDGSELSLKAVTKGIALAKATGAKLTAVTVRPPLRDFVAEGVTVSVTDEDRASYVRQVEHRLDVVRAEAAANSVTAETMQVENAEPWRAIMSVAEQNGVDLIVMASHGRRGVSALVLGSETQKLLTHSKIPVLVYR